jgi:hypothetical protein
VEAVSTFYRDAHPAESAPGMPPKTGNLLEFDLTQCMIVGDQVAEIEAAGRDLSLASW